MAGRFDLETTTLAQLLADPEAKAVIDDVVPELPNHPMIGFVRTCRWTSCSRWRAVRCRPIPSPS